MPESHRKALMALVGVVIVVAAGAIAINLDSTAPEPQDNDTQDVEANSSDESTNQLVGLSASQIEGEITEVTFTDITAEPSSPQIAPEDGIRFVNEAGVDVEVTFDREIPDFQLAAGESIIVDPKSIVYYDATAQDEDAEFRGISARINVQG